MRILGVDPGLTGALFLLDTDGDRINQAGCRVLDMPVVDVEDKKKFISGGPLRDWLLNEARADRAFIEQVNAMPVLITRAKNGGIERRPMPASSAFSQGDSYCSVRTAIEVCGVPWEYVPSPRWKKIHGLKGSDKEASRQKALQQLPAITSLFSRKKDQGRAEAALIAIFGWKWSASQMGGLRARGDNEGAEPSLFES